MVKKYNTYGNFKPRDRLQELELMAFIHVSSEDIENILRANHSSLIAEEYLKLMED